MQKSLSKGKPENLETVLRTERIELLSKAAEQDSVEAVLTAHHQDDQYETVIQRLASGSTFAGLGGIPVKNGIFRRPLLDYPKVSFRLTE
jgi:tRNA(Ile)-lysidine synthase